MFFFKIAAAPLLIALVSFAGRKWGPAVAGWLLGLPLISGPVLFFLTLEQGRQFASRAAYGSLLGLVAWGTFTIVYAYLCNRLSWMVSTPIGWLAYFAVSALLLPLTMKIGWTALLVCAILAIYLLIFPKAPPVEPHGMGRYDLWLRMVTATLMVLFITTVARLLGATASGLLTTFPTYTTILAVFSHRQSAAAAVHMLKGVLAGLYTSAAFFVSLSLALPRMHIAWCFALALACALPVQGASLVYLKKTRKKAEEVAGNLELLGIEQPK